MLIGFTHPSKNPTTRGGIGAGHTFCFQFAKKPKPEVPDVRGRTQIR